MSETIGYCLNTATIREHKLGIVEQVELAAKAGYEAIEPWIDDVENYRAAGGSPDDLRKRIAEAGLKVAGAIGFAPWIVDDDAERARGLEQAQRDMELVRRIGGEGIAAPPAGWGAPGPVSLPAAAERYRKLLELGEQVGVTPMLELWGPSKAFHLLGEVAMIAVEAAHPKACLLLDVYHIYKGGSGFEGLRLIEGGAVRILHMNDYPADPPRATITDADRVYPGDGIAPLGDILGALRSTGFRGWLSLELFNKLYYAQPAEQVVRTGLEKMKAAVARAAG